MNLVEIVCTMSSFEVLATQDEQMSSPMAGLLNTTDYKDPYGSKPNEGKKHIRIY